MARPDPISTSGTVGDQGARAGITTDHDSWLAGWDRHGHLLVSRVVDGLPPRTRCDPATGSAPGDRRRRGPGSPAVSPTGMAAGWWSGTLGLADDGVTSVPAPGAWSWERWPSTGVRSQLTGPPEGPSTWQATTEPSGARTPKQNNHSQPLQPTHKPPTTHRGPPQQPPPQPPSSRLRPGPGTPTGTRTARFARSGQPPGKGAGAAAVA